MYNAQLCNRIEPKIENTIRKDQMAYRGIDPRYHKFWQSVEFLKVYV